MPADEAEHDCRDRHDGKGGRERERVVAAQRDQIALVKEDHRTDEGRRERPREQQVEDRIAQHFGARPVARGARRHVPYLLRLRPTIGTATLMAIVCRYLSVSVVAGSLKKKIL